MGACFQAYSCGAKMTPAQLKADFVRLQEQDRYENGHEYSGGFGQCRGLEVTSQEFTDANAAREWLAENTQKWELAKAVKVRNGATDKRAMWMIGGWCAECQSAQSRVGAIRFGLPAGQGLSDCSDVAEGSSPRPEPRRKQNVCHPCRHARRKDQRPR